MVIHQYQCGVRFQPGPEGLAVCIHSNPEWCLTEIHPKWIYPNTAGRWFAQWSGQYQYCGINTSVVQWLVDGIIFPLWTSLWHRWETKHNHLPTVLTFLFTTHRNDLFHWCRSVVINLVGGYIWLWHAIVLQCRNCIMGFSDVLNWSQVNWYKPNMQE